MSTREQLQAIATRALSDDTFADKLLADPEGTLQAEGVTLSAEEKAELQQALTEAARAAGRESKFVIVR